MIDYILVNIKEVEKKGRVEVQEKLGSDHLPIIYEWGEQEEIKVCEVFKEKKVPCWEEGDIKRYREKCGELKEAKEVKDIVGRAIQWKKINVEKRATKEKY